MGPRSPGGCTCPVCLTAQRTGPPSTHSSPDPRYRRDVKQRLPNFPQEQHRMEFKMVSPDNSEEQDIPPFAIQSYENLCINLVHEGKKLSEVWKYYGLLFNGNTVMNPHRYYCSLCFKDLLENVNNGFRVNFSTVHNVSISTATGNLKMHLLKGHNISTVSESEKDRFDLTFAIKTESKRTRTSADDSLLDAGNIESDLNNIAVNNSLEIGLTEIHEDGDVMTSSYYRLKAALRMRFQACSSVTLITDIWFNSNVSCHYLKIYASFIDNSWELHHYFLCYKPLQSFTSDGLQFHYSPILKEFGIPDKPPGMIHIVCNRTFPHLPFVSQQEVCFVYLTHQLIAKYGLYSSSMFCNLLDKCLTILSTLNLVGYSCLEDNIKDGITHEYLNDLAETFYTVRLDRTNPFASIESLCLIGHSQIAVEETDLNIIKALLNFLAQLVEIPEIFRDCNNSLVVVPVLKNKMAEFCELSHKDEDTVKQIKKSILLHLEDYYQITSIVKLTCALDPSAREILEKNEVTNLLVSKLRTCANSDCIEKQSTSSLFSSEDIIKPLSTFHSEVVLSTSKKLKLLQSLISPQHKNDFEDKFVKEVRQYMQHVPTVEEGESPLLFWKCHSHLYPNLSFLARQYLAVPSHCISAHTILSLNSLESDCEIQNLNLFKLNALSFVRNNSQVLNQ